MGDETASGSLESSMSDLIRSNTAELTALSGNLAKAANGRVSRSILITSAHPGEGKTTTAVSFAVTLANHLNSRVALLDANFHGPRLHELFNLGSSPGLSDALLSDFPINDVLYNTNHENLYLVPAGSPLPMSIGCSEVAKLNSVLDELMQDFRYVIVDSCSFFLHSDVPLYASLFDGTVFVIECGRTKWEVVQQAKEKLDIIGSNVLGAVLNKRRYYIPGNIYGKI